MDATTRRVAIEPCNENSKNAVPFSKNPKAQTYSVVLKIPALLTAARKLAEVEELTDAVSFKGMMYPEDKVVIFDLSLPVVPKRRGKRVVIQEESAEEGGELLGDSINTDTPKRKRGRPKKILCKNHLSFVCLRHLR